MLTMKQRAGQIPYCLMDGRYIMFVKSDENKNYISYTKTLILFVPHLKQHQQQSTKVTYLSIFQTWICMQFVIQVASMCSNGQLVQACCVHGAI